jgi:hypothetical protein
VIGAVHLRIDWSNARDTGAIRKQVASDRDNLVLVPTSADRAPLGFSRESNIRSARRYFTLRKAHSETCPRDG